jgi:hypothetical protein
VAWKGKIYFGSWDCNLYCLNPLTGKEGWRFQTSNLQPCVRLPDEYVLEYRQNTGTEEEAQDEEKYIDITANAIQEGEYTTKHDYASKEIYQPKMKY